MASGVLTQSDLQGSLPLVSRGKVRDIYKIDDQTLLFVTTDRISCHDVILARGIPNKGALLSLITVHWFEILSAAIPGLRTHFLTLDLPEQIPVNVRAQYQNRSMQVRKLEVFQIEAIVRGYITGSAWASYRKDGTVCGIPIQPGLKESEAFPDGPIYTPSTKAAVGHKDENIHPEKAKEIIGARYAERIEELALSLYRHAAAYAHERGIIIADTKFEFGLDKETDEVVLVDEVLTPDNSRFWPADRYKIGESPPSFDKQLLRDWLTTQGLAGKEGVTVPDEVVAKTEEIYKEAFERLTGRTWSATLADKAI
ncbi:Bifunctional purine biosynthetic protein ade1 [Xanthoria parietina]